MSYQLDYMLKVSWVPDGAGPLSQPSAQMIMLGQIAMKGLTLATVPSTQPTGSQQVPGGAAPTQGNFNTALNGSAGTPTGGMALDLSTAIAANLTQIQGFATGGG